MKYSSKVTYKYATWVREKQDAPQWIQAELEIARRRNAIEVEKQFALLTPEEKEDYA